jgi:hypothetical protein
VRPPSQSPEKAKPAAPRTQEPSGEEKVEPAVKVADEVPAGESLTDSAEGLVPTDLPAAQAETVTEEEAVVATEEAAAAVPAETAVESTVESAGEVGEEQEVEGEDVSTALVEGSKMGRSVASAGAETPLEYSTDFENSVSGAEVYKIHE